MSNYKKFTDKQLLVIVKKIQDDLIDDNIEIKSYDEAFEYKVLEVIDEAVQFFNVKCQDIEDYSFFISLCLLNPYVDKESILERPSLKTYEVSHWEHERQWVTNYYTSKIESYIPITKINIVDLEEQDMFAYYYGNQYESRIEDSERTDSGLSDITLVNSKR